MSKTAYEKTALTGGTATSLDGINGSSLTDGDFAYTMVGNVLYVHILNASSGATESSPDVISPDTNAGTKRWILQQTHPASETRAGGAELATTAEAIAGTDTSRIVTPAGLAAAQAVISNPKAYSQGVALTASATVGGIQHHNNTNINMATGNFGHIVGVNLADYSPAADVILYQKHDATNGYIFKLLTTGYLRLTINATSYDSTATVGSAGATDGYGVSLGFSTTRETAAAAGSVLFEINGVQLGSSVAITAGAPTTVSNAVSGYTMGTSSTRYAGIVYYSIPLNFAPTADEHKSAFKNGIPESWKWGSQTAVYSDTAWTGASGATPPTGWTVNIAGVFTIFDSGDGAPHDVCLKQEVNAVPTSNPDIYKSYTVEIGKKYRVDVWYKNIDATSVQIYVGSSANGSEYVSWAGLVGTSWTKKSIEFTATTTVVSIRLRVISGLAGKYALFDEVYITKLGATFALEPEGMQPAPGQWLDSSSNKLHAMQPATGSSLIRYKKEFEFRSTNVWTASSAAQYIGGFNQNVLTTKHMITSIVSRMTVSTDDENITIGDGSDADYYVTDVAPTAAPLIHTLAKNLNDGTNLKLVVTPAAEATMTIEFIVKGIILE